MCIDLILLWSHIAVTNIDNFMCIGITSGCVHEDTSAQLTGTVTAEEKDLNQSKVDRAISVSFAEKDTKPAQ